MARKKKETPEKNPVGRPVIWTEEAAMKLSDELFAWLDKPENIWFEKFIYQEKKLYHQIISELCDKYPKFSDTIKTAKKIQESKIVDFAMKGMTNTTMSIFVLKNNYGWVDKQEQNINANITTFKAKFPGFDDNEDKKESE